MQVSLTPKQLQILERIESYVAQKHTMPSRREIAEGLGLSSPATIQQHIEALEKKGYLKRGETRESRALQWTLRSKKLFEGITAQDEGVATGRADSSLESSNVPWLGRIAAGYPIEVFEDPKTLSVPLSLFLPASQARRVDEVFALTVSGESMKDQGIHTGDWVLVRRTTQVKTGDAVAALVNGEATLKRYVRTKRGIELHPANPDFPVIAIRDSDRFEVQGVLIGVIRRFV